MIIEFRWKLATVVILLIFGLSACNVLGIETIEGSGKVIEEDRQVSGVSGINLATIGNLTIELGDTEAFSITADDNLMEYIKTSVVGGVLTIETKGRVNLRPSKPIKYALTVKSLDSIKVTSVGNVSAPALEAEQFAVTISSTGNVSIPILSAKALNVDISSTGNLTIDGGEVKSQVVNISSTGNYNAQDLASGEANVKLSSTGSANIWVTDSLTAVLSSTGDLHYRGNPTVDGSTNSTGEIIKIGD
jgi:hypothetical protein